MPEEFGVPSMESNDPSFVTEAFGFSIQGEVPPSIIQRLQNAQDIVGQSQQTINQQLTERWAKLAVTTDTMLGDIGQSLGTRLQSVAETTAQLQQPIATQLIGNLGEIYGATIPLGTNLTTPEQAAAPPACVQIRQASDQGDLGPAIECYRSLVFQQRFTRGGAYTETVNFITDSLNPTPSIRDAWARVLQQMENEPSSPVQSFDQIEAGGLPLESLYTAGSGPPPAPAPVYQQSSQVLNPGGSFFPTPETFAPVVAPLTSPIRGAMLPGSGAPPTSVPVALPPPPGVIQRPNTGPEGGSICTNQYGTSWIIPPGMVCGSGPPPPTVIPPTPPPSYIPPSTPPTTAPAAPAPPPSTRVPETPRTPPKPPEQPCIKLCPTEPPKCEYQLICSSDHILYIIKATDKPRSTFDRVIAKGDPAGWDIDKLAQDCQIRAPQPEPPPPGPAAFGVAPVNIPGCAEFGAVPGVAAAGQLLSLSNILGFRNNDGSINTSWAPDDPLGIGKAVARTLTGFWAQLIDQLAAAGNAVLNGSGCASGQMYELVLSSSVLNLLRNFLGDSLDQFRVPNAQQRNFLCPTALPQAEQAGRAWLSNTIDENTLECWVRACGTRYPEFKRYIDANRSKLAAVQYGTLEMRDKLAPGEYDRRIRELGFTQPNDGQDVLNLLKQIPPPSDLVRMMVRDAADEELVRQFRLDDQFTDKFTGDVEKWSRQQGIDPTYMRFLWRSHWSIPSPGQLAGMLHRLSRLPAGDPAYVDQATIRRALVQQDIAPFWIDKFIATSFHPLTRIDARRAYENGSLDDQGLIEAYLNLGYDQQNAERLLSFNRIQRMLKFARSPHVKDYAKGEINGAQLDDQLKAEGATEGDLGYVHLATQVEMDKLRRRRCLTSLRRRFLQGDLDPASTIESIRSQGLDPEQAQNLFSGWQCERDARGKAIPAGELCGLYEQGALTISDLTERLQRIGYSYDDSILLARRCAQRVSDKLTKEEAKRLKQQAADEQKQINQLLRQAARDERARRAQTQNALRAQRVKLAQTKRIQEAALNYSKYAGVSLPDGVATIEAIIGTFLAQTLNTRDEIIQAVLVESRSPQADSVESLTEAAQAALTA